MVDGQVSPGDKRSHVAMDLGKSPGKKQPRKRSQSGQRQMEGETQEPQEFLEAETGRQCLFGLQRSARTSRPLIALWLRGNCLGCRSWFSGGVRTEGSLWD